VYLITQLNFTFTMRWWLFLLVSKTVYTTIYDSITCFTVPVIVNMLTHLLFIVTITGCYLNPHAKHNI